MPDTVKSDARQGFIQGSQTRQFTLARVVSLVLAVASMSLVAMLPLGCSRKAEGHAKTKTVMHLESFVLNMAEPNQSMYLRVGIDLGLESERKPEVKEGAADPNAAMVPIVRDTILSVLMQVNAAQISTSDGKAQLKERLIAALQKRLPDLGVREVYFTEFLIQS